ncbi:MAG: IS21 family transposase [Nevskiales bacterium]
MLCVETIGKIRRYRFVEGKSIKAIARELRLARNTVRRAVREQDPSSVYIRRNQPRPKLGRYLPLLERLLEEDETRSAGERRCAERLFEVLRLAGYAGAHDSVGRYVATWRKARRSQPAGVFVPLSFAPGEAYQFDWSYEQVEIGGVPQVVKVAHLRLCHSRMPFVAAYPRETQEMVFDAHVRAFAFLGGVTKRGIYDNLKTAVDAILFGKDRKFNRRFLQLCSHYLVEPVACTPAAGWEKGRVERQVGDLRQVLFRPRPKVRSLAELNDWLVSRCLEMVQGRRHPEQSERTVWEVYQDERRALLPLPKPFDGYAETELRVSSTSLVRFDRNRYSVACRAVGQLVSLRAYADRIKVLHHGEVVAAHPRQFGRDKTVFDPWHYVPALTRKPGALRNGAPFQDWSLPPALTRIRARLAKLADGDRQFVAILSAALQDGLDAVEQACASALSQGTVSSDAVLNALLRAKNPPRLPPVTIPQALTLAIEPRADCARYDALRGAV